MACPGNPVPDSMNARLPLTASLAHAIAGLLRPAAALATFVPRPPAITFGCAHARMGGPAGRRHRGIQGTVSACRQRRRCLGGVGWAMTLSRRGRVPAADNSRSRRKAAQAVIRPYDPRCKARVRKLVKECVRRCWNSFDFRRTFEWVGVILREEHRAAVWPLQLLTPRPLPARIVLLPARGRLVKADPLRFAQHINRPVGEVSGPERASVLAASGIACAVCGCCVGSIF